MREMQLDIAEVFLDPDRPDVVLAIYATGSGKTHLIRTVGAIERGIVLIFIPLLTLSADVMAKFTDALQQYGEITVHHLDELWDNNKSKYGEVLSRLRELRVDTTSTIFVFISPQFLVFHRDALQVMLGAIDRRVLRTIVLDEFHLHVQHGESFRHQIRHLRDIFFRPAMHPRSPNTFVPRLLATSATVPFDYPQGLGRLLTIDIPPRAIFRGSEQSFTQLDIKMEQIMCNKGDFVQYGLAKAVAFLQSDPDGKCVIFTNSRERAIHYTTELETKLNYGNVVSDVILIHGCLQKHDKFWRIRLFCSSSEPTTEVALRVLISTSASNVGIDNNKIRFGLRFGFPRDMSTYFQEKGRGSRRPGDPSVFILYADIASFEFIMINILGGVNDTIDEDEETETDRLRAVAMTAMSTPVRRNAESRLLGSKQPTRSSSNLQLTRAEKRRLRRREIGEALDVQRFFCLDGGCQQVRGAQYLATGVLRFVPVCERTSCVNQCPVCSGDWNKQFFPVYKDSVIRFFESSVGRSSLPVDITKTRSIGSIIWGNIYWIESIFDRAQSGVKRRNVNNLFLSLAAAGIMHIEKHDGGHRWALVWSDPDTLAYHNDELWDGIPLLPSNRRRTRNPTVPTIPA